MAKVKSGSRAELAEEFLFVHAVLEGFATIDEDDGDFVIVEAAYFCAGIYVNFAPVKAPALLKFDEALLDDFAEMTSLAGIDDDFPSLIHRRECSSSELTYQGTEVVSRQA
jgi:hypothetical protein